MQGKKKILVVDDVPETLLALKIRLQYSGYEVLTAKDGAEGLAMARECKPDLIILDVMLPKMDGFSVCRLLKFDEEYEHIPIIMLTARGQDRDKEIGKKVGADLYITKPYDPKLLLQEVQHLTNEEFSTKRLTEILEKRSNPDK